LNRFVETLGTNVTIDGETFYIFPTPEQVAQADLSFLKMPQSRKETLSRFAQFVALHPDSPPEDWLTLKGIGPWTIQYAQLRGLSEPNHFLTTDLVVKKALKQLPDFDPETLSPWGSYATFHCWNSQS
jgi:AraC family transcriptional regulator of adaptative response / DNA-3-methyladenine glycosylase II